jgi:Tol biopolymer transport system component
VNAGPRGLRRSAVAVGGLALAATAATLTTAHAGTAAHNAQVVLVDATNAQADAKSSINGTAQVTSHNGDHVVFSTAAALVPEDDNGLDDVYLRDVSGGTTVLVSARDGVPGDDYSVEPTISAGGRYVAFTTWATNLTGRDANGHDLDVVVKDMRTGTIELVSVDSRERQQKRNSFFPVISGDGRFVSFQTFNAFGSKDEDRKEDVYVRDLAAGKTRQASLLPGTDRDVRGSVLNGDISDDGRVVVFGNNTMLWARDMVDGETIRFHHEAAQAPCNPMPGGSAGRPVVSGNGRFVAFSSCAEDLPGASADATDIWRKSLDDRGRIVRVTSGNDYSYLPSLSRNGRVVGFGSDASNLVAGDDEGRADAFVADLAADTLVRASQAADGTGGNRHSATTDAAISGDGRSLAYLSYADNLVPGDEFDWREVLVWRR